MSHSIFLTVNDLFAVLEMLNKWEQEQSSALHLQQSCCALLGSAPVPSCPTQVSLAVSHPLAAVPS